MKQSRTMSMVEAATNVVVGYPRSLLEDISPDHEVNSALNCALISWKTNRRIGAKTPKDYIEERAADAKASSEQVRHRLESHLVPYDDLIGGDFAKFLEERAKLVHAPMRKLCNGLLP